MQQDIKRKIFFSFFLRPGNWLVYVEVVRKIMKTHYYHYFLSFRSSDLRAFWISLFLRLVGKPGILQKVFCVYFAHEIAHTKPKSRTYMLYIIHLFLIRATCLDFHAHTHTRVRAPNTHARTHTRIRFFRSR